MATRPPAARAVLQTGEYDYAWNLQVEDDILLRMEQGGKGRVNIWRPAMSSTPCATSVIRGRTSTASGRAPRPRIHSSPIPPSARRSTSSSTAGRARADLRPPGADHGEFLDAPARVRSSSTRWEFNVDKANQILDAAGWKRAADGVRVKDGKRLKMLYQTATNAPREKTQQIAPKQARGGQGGDRDRDQVGGGLGVLWLGTAANPDNYPHFYYGGIFRC